MCIAVFIWQDHPIYDLILLLNRDEYHDRPTKPLGWWDGGDIVGGRDELAGGTWLASSRDGRLAFVTNVREVRTLPAAAKSRGDLPVQFLQSKKKPMDFAEELAREADHYNGFNMILVDLCLKSMVYMTNRPAEEKVSALEVSPGIHVLSNASLDSPWHKATRLHHSFEALLETYTGCFDLPIEEMVERLMMDRTKEKHLLPEIYPPEREYQLSSIFVEEGTPMGKYGTRSTSAVTVKPNGDVCFYERHLEKEVWKEQTLFYRIERT